MNTATAQPIAQQDRRSRASAVVAWGCFILGALLLPLATLQTVVPLAAWLAPLLLLRFVRARPGRIALPLVIVAHQIALAIGLRDGFFPLPTPILVGMVLIIGALLALGYVADRLLAPRLPAWADSLVFPLTVTGVDFLLAERGPFATFLSPAFTQYGNLPLVQIASVAGIYGLTFLMTWTAAAANGVWQRGLADRGAQVLALVNAGVLLVVLLAGGARLAFDHAAGPTVAVAALTPRPERYPYPAELAQASAAERAALWARSAPVLDDLLARTRQEARDGARIVVWSELAARIPEENLPEVLARLQQVAREEQIYLVAGIGAYRKTNQFPYIRNRAVMVDPAGTIVIDYAKAHPIPGSPWDAADAGPAVVPTVDTPYGRLAVVICYDADFPDLIRQAGRAGAAMLLVPGFDWAPIRYRHTEMTTFRAVENGVALVRATGGGIAIATDAQGRVLSMVDDTPTDPSALTAAVPTVGTTTLYPFIGDAFAWLCVGGLAVLGGWVVLRRWLRVETWGEPGPHDVVPPWMRRKG